ncbi:MAG: ComF family protein [Verrucomicrobiota bacterium]
MNIVSSLKRASNALASLLYPPHCAQCSTDTPIGHHLCPLCLSQAETIVDPFCQRCSEPFHGAITSAFTCSNCADRTLHFSAAITRYRSQGIVRNLIHRFKYDGHFYLRHPLADWLLHSLDDPRILAIPIDAFIPVPLHPTRFRERQFNQAEVLASLLAKHTAIPILHALSRTRYTSTQTRLDRLQRMENLRNAFRLVQSTPVHNRHLVLVDDVFTTGSTVNECARVLTIAGAASVRVVTIARG